MPELLIIILLLLMLATLAIGFYFTNNAYKPKYWDYEASLQDEVTHNIMDKAEFDALPREDFYITADDGVKINAWYFPNGDAKDTVIIAHGYSYTKYGSVKFMNMFRKLGFNALLYDQRGHGTNERTLCTMGFKEKLDLKKCVDWVVARNGEDAIIGTQRTLQGKSTTLM